MVYPTHKKLKNIDPTRPSPTQPVGQPDHRCKKLRFLSWSLFYVFNDFLFSKRFFYLKNVGKVQSSKQIINKHFQNNSNEIDL